MTIRIQPDSAGQRGDVRDIVMTRGDREIGMSVKRNHEAVKHSRLSPRIDFGKKWELGQPCSQNYWREILPIFSHIGLQAGREWSELVDKGTKIYRPIMCAFRAEMDKICNDVGASACAAVTKYLIGKRDFYKVMALNDVVKVQAFNLNRTLKVGRGLKLPTRLASGEFKEGSNNTVVLIFDGGWSLSFRVHNATKKVEKSLKLDITLLGYPRNLYTHHLPVDGSCSA